MAYRLKLLITPNVVRGQFCSSSPKQSPSVQPPKNVWSRLSDLESWWLKSNPGHISLDIGSPGKRVAVGTEGIAFEERVDGIKACASGTVISLIPGTAATWEEAANYRYCGFDLAIQEGVIWCIEPNMGSSTLSTHTWARFPAGAIGQLPQLYSTRILHVIERDRTHDARSNN